MNKPLQSASDKPSTRIECVWTPMLMALLAVSLFLPILANIDGEIHANLVAFPIWGWLYSPVSLCVAFALLAGCVFLVKRKRAPFMLRWRSFAGSATIALFWGLLFNPFAFSSPSQLPLSLVFVLAMVYLTIAAFRAFSYGIWFAVLMLSLIQYAACSQGMLLNHTNLMQVFTTSWEDAKQYLTSLNIFLFIAAIICSFFAYHVMYRVLRRNTSPATLAFNGSLLLLLFFLAVKPLQGHLAVGRELIWPIGNTEALASESARAILHIRRISRIIEMQPPCGITQAHTDMVSPQEEVLCVIHVGESARADHWSINGYERETTPFFRSLDGLLSFPDCTSSASSTDRAMPVMLTNARRDFLSLQSKTDAPSSPPLGEFFEACHYRCASFWYLDVITGPPHSLFTREVQFLTRAMHRNYEHEDMNPEEQLDQISEFVSENAGKPQFLLINNKGSHAFFHWFDQQNPPFTPVHLPLPNDAPATHPAEAMNFINAYDNTVHYTDQFIRNLFERLKGKAFLYVYMSDHGEYLGDGGYWSRGNAPQDAYYQYDACKVPFAIYASPELLALKPELRPKMECLKEHRMMRTAHEHLFHTILGLFNIQTPFYEEKLDLSSERACPYDGPHPGQGHP